MITPHELVTEFHETYGMPVGLKPQFLKEDRQKLRISLIEEELQELHDALWDKSIVDIADALGDLVYVIYGMAIEMGINLTEVLAEIQKSNMSKLGVDGKPIYREDGKVLKGPNFEEPDLNTVLVKQGMEF